MRPRQVAFLLMLMVLGTSAVYAQSAGPVADQSEQRKARILVNLKQQIPQLRQYNVVMGTLQPSSIPGVDEGQLIINGQQVQPFLVTQDDTQLFLVGAGPIDVSMTEDELAALVAEEEAAAAQQAEATREVLASLIEGLPVRGNPDAPVTLVEFSDFQCPYCSRGFTTVEQILEKYPNDVKLVYVQYPIESIHPWARPASIAALCAAQQDEEAFWTLHDSYFQNQRQINPGNVVEKSRTFLADTGIDLETWESCATDTTSDAYTGVDAAIDHMLNVGQQLGITGTPGFFVNGYPLKGAKPVEEFDVLIQQEMEAAQ